MVKSYKYRIYPTTSQELLFKKTFGCTRVYWNALVDEFKSGVKDENYKYTTSKEIREKFPWIKEISATALQQKRKDFEEVKKQYFSVTRKTKIKQIKHKNKKSKQSYRLTNQKFRFIEGKIYIEKVGKVKVKIHREIPEHSKFLSLTIIRTLQNQYYIIVNFEYNNKIKQKVSNTNVGIDLGISSIATLSDGVQFSNLSKIIDNQDKIRTAQKHLSRKIKGSQRWLKQKKKLGKLHNKMVNQKMWYLHNISRWIVENYNEISMEDLCIKDMLKNKNISYLNSITPMGKLKELIIYKQKEYGKEVFLYPRFEPSTKKCSSCGNIQPMKLIDRIFNCKKCDLIEDRDVNAAINIKQAIGVNVALNERGEAIRPIPSQIEWRQSSMKRLSYKDKNLI